jgi:hypothetical protein
VNTFINLVGHINTQDHARLITTTMTLTRQLNAETAVQLPVPFIPIGNGLAIAPAIDQDGETALRVDLARWAPAHVSSDLVAVLPINFNAQSMAVQVARAFDADPTTSWSASLSEVTDWLIAWGPANGLNVDALAGDGGAG